MSMQGEWGSTFCAWVTRLLYFDVPRPLRYAYVFGLTLVYFFVAVHTPMSLYPGLRVDDGLYASLGQYLAEGHWLGPFNEFTLAKGPGYPIFLAISNWLGLSASVAYPLLHCGAVIFFVVVAHRFIKSLLISGLFFAFLLWHPISLTLFRVVREQIYSAQTLLVLALMVYLCLWAQRPSLRLACAALGGLVLGWFWLTREEGIWILPGLAILVVGAGLVANREHRLRGLIGTLLIVIATFVGTLVGFRTMNSLTYGMFVGVDIKETNFQRAFGAINSVRGENPKQYVSVTQATRERIYSVSPTFATLKPYLEGDAAWGWRKMTCETYPDACGEIAAGWFMWALRGAAAKLGQYKSPKQASLFFGRIADEISAACAGGALKCSWQPVSELPPVTWRQLVTYVPPGLLDALKMLVWIKPPLQIFPSWGNEELLSGTLKFLHHPPYARSAEMPNETTFYVLQGWFYKSGGDWFSASVEDASGVPVDFRFSRRGSPDIAKAKDDPAAHSQRFTIETKCNEKCSLHVYSSDNIEAKLILGGTRKVPFGMELGRGALVFDHIEALQNPNALVPFNETLSRRIRETVFTYYDSVFFPFLMLGAATFLICTVLFWRAVLWNPCYVLALACWTLVLVRALLLVLIDITSFHALQTLYMSPAYFLQVSAVFFSIAALPQLACSPVARDSNVEI